MAFAAYNAGPGNLARFRKWAQKSGLDPNVWFFNVEEGAARVVGQETVTYVGNIYKYYIAYKLLAERQAQSTKATAPAVGAPRMPRSANRARRARSAHGLRHITE